jgi:sugar lactone lactonase YvrE
MKDIETLISPFIENQFPSFYKDQGENFILFVKAYFEWLEQNHQLLTLESYTDFNVGDTLAQGTTTGKIVAYVDGELLVYVNGFDTFKCLSVCSDITPITSSSGGATIIKKGGRTKRMGSLFFARNLPKLRDIDKTIDIFILHFKEKYLKNIEFDTATNQRLLVKNSQDLYRSKGTERSIDLFFKLVYGVDTDVYYPADDLFKLSDGEWVVPQYLEITSTDRSIDLVGKQVKGVTSGATAFVEKYIKRKIKSGFVYVFNVSAVAGAFINNEILVADDTIFDDSPRLIGSLNRVEIGAAAGTGFAVGDIVSFVNSGYGDYGLARVDAVADDTGIVDFIFLDGGWGYTSSSNSDLSALELAKRSQSIVSEKVLTLSNVVTSNTVDVINVTAGGLGYNNTDVITIATAFVNTVAIPTTNATGGIQFVTVTNPGSGFYTATVPTANIIVKNSSGGSTSSSATLTAITKVNKGYFNYFESLTQPKRTINYGSAINATALVEGSLIRYGNSSVTTGYGYILTNSLGTSSNGTLEVSLSNGTIVSNSTTNTIFLNSNSSIYATALAGGVSNTSANAAVMGIPTEVTLTISSLAGSINRDNVLYQQLSTGEIIGKGIVSTTAFVGTSGTITLSNVTGAFRKGYTLYNETVVGSTATITEVGLTVGLYNITGNYTNVYNAFVYSMNTATTANVVVVSQGTGAGFKVNALADTETVFLNTDLLGANNAGYTAANSTVMANQAFMSLPVANYAYGFPKSPQGNSASIIWSCLAFDLYELGTIGTLSSINPGADYNIDPYVLVRQPFISSLNYHDYNMNISGATGNFLPGEYIYQASTSSAQYNLVVSDETGYQVGEKVYQGASLASSTANATIVSITPSANSIQVKDVGGTFATSTALKSVVNVALSATVLSETLQTITSTARGIVKAGSNTSVLKIKRINLENGFVAGQTISGQTTQSNATIVSVAEDFDTLPIGFNASIQANVVTSNGTITTLTVVDSGVGYSLNGSDLVEYRSEDGLRAGEAKLIIDGIGTGSGYFKSSKGFLSTNKYIHDGDYYQEYSYEILTKIPFLKYSDMFKKVMHTAGTRFFGAVLLENTATASVDVVDDSISNSTVSTIQFNSNSSVSANAILFDNDPTIFADGNKVTYYTATSNSVISPLSNSSAYYVANSNTTAIRLTTNPRALAYTFNSNTAVEQGYANVRNSFAVGDYVKYTTAAGNTAIAGLANNDTYYVVASNTGFNLSKSSELTYTALSNNTVFANGTFAVPTANGNPAGLSFKPDGTRMYVTCGAKSTQVQEYALSTPWQVNTATFSSNTPTWYSSTGQIGANPWGATFKPDGTIMYLVFSNGDKVAQFALSVPWSVNTASFTQAFDTQPAANSITFANSSVNATSDFITFAGANSVIANGTSVIFSTTTAGATVPGGITANNVVLVIRYANSTGFALSTSVSAANVNITSAGTGSFKVKQSVSTLNDIKFKPDGTRMYVARNGLITYEYLLSSSWDISTATLNYTLSGSSPVVFISQGVTFSADGRKMFTTGVDANGIYSYNLSTPWVLSTAVVDQVKKTISYSNAYALELKPDASKFFVADNNSNTIAEFDWSTMSPSTISENGHTVSISTINIIANSSATGAATSGHFIATFV